MLISLNYGLINPLSAATVSRIFHQILTFWAKIFSFDNYPRYRLLLFKSIIRHIKCNKLFFRRCSLKHTFYNIYCLFRFHIFLQMSCMSIVIKQPQHLTPHKISVRLIRYYPVRCNIHILNHI